MLSDRLTRGLARVVLASYVTHLLAPVAQACDERGDIAVLPSMDSLAKHGMRGDSMRSALEGVDDRQPLKPKPLQSPLEPQLVKIPPSLKTEGAASLLPLPTLSIRLGHLPQKAKGNTYRLSIERTRPFGSEGALTDFQWKRDFSFPGLKAHKAPSSAFTNHTVHFPLMGSLTLTLSESGQLTAFSTIDSSGFYQGNNYRFQVVGDLHLANLITDGHIDVTRAHEVSAEGEVFGQEGIFLKVKKEIRIPSGDPHHPIRLHSKKRITLNTPYLDNKNSCIQAPLIEGRLGRRGQESASLDNTKGVIEATDFLSLVMATDVFNEGGVLNASAGKTKVSIVGSFLNKKGFVGGKRGLDLLVQGELQNPGGKVRSKGTATVKAGSWFHTDGAEAWAKNLEVIHTPITTDETSRMGADDLFHFSLPRTQQAIIYPINTLGWLEIDREGNSPDPLHLLANLIAKKGLKVRLPEAPLIVGAEEENQSMVKLQAEEGLMDLQSKSLDIVKAQLFSKTGMRWEVQEKQIHIGRGVENIEPLSLTFNVGIISVHGCAGMKQSILKCNLASHLASRLINMLNTFWRHPYCTKTYDLPFKNTNGTSVATQGSFNIVSPEGVLIDRAELTVEKDWDVITTIPVKNEGGNVQVKGDVKIHLPLDMDEPPSSPFLQNILQGKAYDYTAPYLSLSLVYPYTQGGRITIGGDLDVNGVENIGSFFHVAGTFRGKGTITEKPFLPSLAPYFMDGAGITETFPSTVSFAKGAAIQDAKNPVLEGVLQTPFLVMSFEGKAMVGRIANYQRQATPPFQQMKMFMDVHRPTALFQPVNDALTPWINQPTVPLSWTIDLPPAVGLGPNGLYLLDPSEKLLLHPLQEVGNLPSVFGAQLRRGYLDEDHPEALATYIMGRRQAYDLYLKLFAPKALEGVPQDHTPADNPERALRALDTTLAHTMAHTMTEEEVSQLKFMMLYYGMPFEGKTVHLPVSWLSKHYDDPRVRNPDGGVFARIVLFKGKTPDSVLHCVSNIHGEALLGIDVAHTILERQSHHYVTYHTNTTTKKGSWWQDDKVDSQTVAIYHNTAQPNTGNMTTGPNGQAAFRGALKMLNGSSIEVGTQGIAVDLKEFQATPSDNTSVACANSSARGTSVIHHYQTHNLQPASITSTGGVGGTIEDMNVKALQVIAHQGDINLQVKDNANLLTHQVAQSSGVMVSKRGKAVITQEIITPIALPCSFLALNGSVVFTVGGKLYGVAPHFLGKVISLDAQETDITSLLMANKIMMTSETEGIFSTQTSNSSQETPSILRAIFDGDEIHIRGEKGKLEGVLIKGKALYDHTIDGLVLAPLVREFLYSQRSVNESPFSSSDVGCKGGYESMVPTVLMVDKVVRQLDNEAQMTFNAVEWDRNRTEIIGKFAETTYQLKQWHTEWAHHEQLIPDEALVVVALAVGLATKGMGVKFLSPLLKGITAATGMQLSAMGIAMVNAGVATVCASATTSGLRTGDPVQVAKDLTSANGLRSLGISMLSAGLCHQIAGVLEIDMNPGLKPFMDHFQEQALRGTIDGFLNVAIADVPVDEAFTTTLKQIPIKTIAACVANKIGSLYGDNKMGFAEHKVLHGILGGGMGFALDPTGKGFLAGAVGAITAEVVGEALVANGQEVAVTALEKLKEEGVPLTKENIEGAVKAELRHKADIARITAGSVSALLGQDASIAIATATNAVDNNLLVMALPFVLPEVYAILAATSLGIATILAQKETGESFQELDRVIEEKRRINAMDAAPQEVQGRDEGFAAHEGKPTIHSTPVHDLDLPQEGFTAGVDGLPVLGGYQLPDGLPDTSVLNNSKQGEVKPKTYNQLNQEIKTGKAPRGIERIDKGTESVKGEQPHVHFRDGSALNKDGTWKDGNGTLSNAQKEWLLKNGWNIQ